jgi:peroxiredoxin
LRDIAGEIQERGAELVVVGSGSPEQARSFAEERDLPFPVLADPKLEAFQAAELRSGVGALLKLGMIAHGKRAARKGFRQGRVQGSATQLGGLFVIGRGGALLMEQRSREAGDHADPAAVLAALSAS